MLLSPGVFVTPFFCRMSYSYLTVEQVASRTSPLRWWIFAVCSACRIESTRIIESAVLEGLCSGLNLRTWSPVLVVSSRSLRTHWGIGATHDCNLKKPAIFGVLGNRIVGRKERQSVVTSD